MAKPNHKIAAGIFKLIASEGEARFDYESFLDECPDLAAEDVATIREIQSDEANHLLKLQAMARKYDGGIAVSPDGVAQAISEITSKMN